MTIDTAVDGGRIARLAGRARRMPTPVAVTVMAVVGAAVHLLRDPTAIVAAGFWAEDGTIYFADAVERGWGTLLEPYGSQLFLFPRAVAALVAPLPVVVQPVVYAIVAIAVAVASCSIILSSRWGGGGAPLAIRFAALIALLAAPGVGETYATLANAHWWMGIGLLLLAMLHDPTGRIGRIGELTFVGLAVLSGFTALYGLPALAVRALRSRSGHSIALAATATAGLAVQVAYLVADPRGGDAGEIAASPGASAAVLLRRVLGTLAIGDTNLPDHWPGSVPHTDMAVAAAALATALAFAWFHGRRLELMALLATIVGGWALALWGVSGLPGGLDLLFIPGSATRYFVIPRAAVVIGLVVSWRPGLAWVAAATVATGIMLVGVLADFEVDLRAPYGGWSEFAACVETTRDRCRTTIAPDWELVVQGRGD